MPDFEFEFNQQDKDLIVNQSAGEFGNNDYMRLTIYPSETINQVVTLQDNTKGIDGKAIFFSTLFEGPFSINVSPFTNDNSFDTKIIGNDNVNDFKIYKNPNGGIYIKPNEIFNKFELPQGDYRIQIDFLNQFSKGQVSQQPLPIPYWFEDFDFNGDGIVNVVDVSAWNQVGRTDIGNLILANIAGTADDPPSYYAESDSQEGQQGQQGGGQEGGTDFETNPLRGPEYYYSENLNPNAVVHYNFIIKQISTSRKEVRLKIFDEPILNDSDFITNLTNELNQNTNTYQFKHVLNIGTGDHNPIMNYQFDAVTDGKNNQSIILKLYEPLANNVNTLSPVTIEKEVLTTQIQDIYYFSDVPEVFFGDGLQPDPQENWINPDGNIIGFENYNQIAISSSIENTTIDSIISSSEYGYPSLNTDFNEFSNHTFFGSAKKKLENFKTKVETIQGFYTNISSSLSSSGISMTGDNNELIQRRKNLFEKIEKEFRTFTPYERFLYFDGQSNTTASAPSLTNYADTKPVRFDGDTLELSQHNGFNTVYKFSSEKISSVHDQFIHLFTDKYKVQNKPFFNYSGSIYLSFLLQGDSGSALSWDTYGQTTAGNGLGVPLPNDALHQNRILEPLITGSEYRRFIYEASQSYWIPNQNIDFSDLPTIDNNGELIDSSNVTFLHTNIKTGSYQINDSTGQYPTTVVTQSGAPFFGACMPAGELFRIYNKNNLSASLFAHYNYENITIDDRDFEVLDVSGNNRTISWDGGSTDSFTSASVETGVDGKISSSLKWSGSNAGASGLFYFNSNIDNEAGRVTFTTSSGVDQGFDGFTFTSWLKTEDTNITIMSLDIKSSGSGVQDNVAVNHSSLDDVDGWWVGKSGASIQGQVTDQGHKVLNKSDFKVNPSNADLTDNEFHHYALSWNQTTGTGSLYIDGVNVKTLAGYPLSGSNVIYRIRVGNGPGSALGYGDGQFDETRFYLRSLNDSEINQLYLHPDGKTETKITDVKVTLKDPTNVLPFDNMFKTTSTEFTDWYNGMLTKAETFDTDNIHSFENNLPLYIQESSEYNDMKDFLNLQGEQYDLIRNHIDSLGTLHDRGYKETNSPPNNTLPMLLSSMGWQGINPFEGNLTETLGSYLSGITSIDDIKNNTWRKTLNNLLYIYKTKGTKNSVRALLNTYGYPPDVLNFKEFGGSVNQSIEDGLADDNNPMNDDNPPPLPTVESSVSTPTTLQAIDKNLDIATGSFNFITKKEKFYRYRFAAKSDRVLNLNWWMDDANLNTIQFVYKHDDSNSAQTILKSSGSGAETLWDLRLIPSSTSSSFEFRINSSSNGAGAIATNAFSMSTAYENMHGGQLWNVMLQRMNSSTSTNITHEYRLHASLQNNKTIEKYNYITMSIAGGSSAGEQEANKNWMSSGSRHYQSSSNLFVGESLSGSLGEIRGWSTALSTSKFRQHTLNKSSIVGNTLLSHCKELRYRFKLNENYGTQTDNVSGSGNIHPISSSTQVMKITDSAAKHHLKSDYSFNVSASVFLSSTTYGFDIIDVVKPTLQDNLSVQNDNNIIINPNKSIISDLDSKKSSTKSLTDSFGNKQKLNTSTKLELYNSPQNFIDDFILDKLAGFNLEQKYGSPTNFYSQSYTELDLFRDEFFDCYPIEKNTNKFIRSQESMLNHSLSEGLKQVSPARSTFSDKNSNFGVEIRPTVLEKQKYEHHRHSVETNPNTGIGIIDVDSITYIPTSNYESLKEGDVNVNVTNTSTYEQPKSASINVNVTNVTTYERPKSASISVQPTYGGSTIVTSKDGTIDYASRANESYTSVHKNWGTTENDVHFINYFNIGTNNDYNTRHIDTRFVFHTIGDNEYYSASNESDFTNARNFYNRKMIDTDFHSSVNYESLIGGNTGTQIGRMMGKTRYFITSSNGSITLPRNHVVNFNNPFKERMSQGTQNTDPGQLNVQYEDYSTASFYSVIVTGGENQIRVNSGNPSKGGGDGRIIYNK